MKTPFQMSGPANAGAVFSSTLRQRLKGRTVDGALADDAQAKKFQAGLARQQEINAGNFPVKPNYAKMGTMGAGTLASRESQKATGQPMGTMTSMLPSRASQAMKPQVAGNAPAAGGFPVKPKSYASDFVGPVPDGGVREAGLLPAPVLNEQTGAAFPVKPQQPGRGFSAYLDEQMGGAGWKTSTRDGQAGAVAQDGAYRGQTRQGITAALRQKFLAMSPEERAKYDQQAEILSGVAGRPDAPSQSMVGNVTADTMAMQQGMVGKKRKGLLEEMDPNEMEPDEDWDD